MELINSKDLKKIFDECVEFDTQDEERYPCFQVKIDKEKRKAMIFLIDGREILSYSLSKLNKSYLTVERISGFIKILRTGNIEKLCKRLQND